MHILVVESSRVQQIILSAIFKEYRFAPVFVATIAEARIQLEKNHFELVFISYNLPDGSGVEVANAIQELAKNKTRPTGVVLLTTEDKHSIFKEALTAGVTRIIFRANIEQIKSFLEEIVNSQFDFSQLEKHALVISSSNKDIKKLSNLLESNDIIVSSYQDASDAVRYFTESEIDIVIIDDTPELEIPTRDIIQLVRKTGGIASLTPIILLASQQSDRDQVLALKEGANDYISKPYVDEVLYLRLNNLIMQKKLLDRLDKQRERLETLAMTDQLTSLFNRHFLVKFAPQKLAEAKRHQHSLSLIAVDIDYFKKINDLHGHEMGDEVLRQVATILRQSCRKEDIAVRFGGEEFLLMLPHCDIASGENKAELLRKQIEILRPENIPISASFGVTSMPLNTSDEVEFSTLFNTADEALYEAKRSGRNQTVAKSC